MFFLLCGMVEIKGFKNVSYREFQSQLQKKYDTSGKTYIEIASAIKVKTHTTVLNAFNLRDQVVSDKVLMSVMGCLGFSGMMVSYENKKYYYISKEKKSGKPEPNPI